MRLTLKVEGMTCGHCKAAVEKAVKSLSGVTFAEVDLVAGSLTAEFDEALLDSDKIKEVIDDAGYTVA